MYFGRFRRTLITTALLIAAALAPLSLTRLTGAHAAILSSTFALVVDRVLCASCSTVGIVESANKLVVEA